MVVVSDVQVGDVEVHEGEAGVVQAPVPKGGHVLVQALTDAAHLAAGDARADAERLYQLVDGRVDTPFT